MEVVESKYRSISCLLSLAVNRSVANAKDTGSLHTFELSVTIEGLDYGQGDVI